MSDPLVSVIVPIYNHAAYVLETVGSVVSQTHPRLQIIVIDDGSTDDGALLVREHFGSRVQLYTQANGGPGSAVNAAFKRVDGDYIAFLGGDDVCEPQRIAHQLAFLRAAVHDLVFAKPQMIDMTGKPLPDSEVPVLYVDQEPGPEMYRRMFLGGNFLCGPSAMMRSEVLAALGGFHEGLVGLQDFDYWLRACGKGMSLGVDAERVVRYRRHPGNLSGTSSMAALASETAYMLKRSLDEALPRVVRAAFPHVFPPRLDMDTPLSAYEKSLLLLAHPLKEVQAVGLGYALDIAESGNVAELGGGPDLNMFHFLMNTTRNM
ncbi:glycosyltransferase family 2 protein [Caballeronia novacaledonica]|uniref:glycosyltransferase family 2 protein n=1 Tax=Caballeronia novacaledonica TaxID=1544861 RepID=UPI001EE37154|nr:glycosyltransferase family 2 protein [Caballeronia novacaledonica]GJH09277.1 glycosyltransferase family 2 protein [Caballeronia novacaledonica]